MVPDDTHLPAPQPHTTNSSVNTPRSSVTLVRPPPLPIIQGADLSEEIAQDKERLSRYGGDDIEEPRPKAPPAAPLQKPNGEKSQPSPSALFRQKTRDPNLVAWDGANDPANPQNWSVAYKWFLTLICMLLCVNVCVFLHFLSLNENTYQM